MNLTKEWLKSNNACSDCVKWWEDQTEADAIRVVLKLVDHNYNWSSWLLVRLMSHKQKVQYAVFAAEQVIEIYEKKYPKDDRPRKAIEAAKAFIKDPSDNKKKATNVAAANAAYAAAVDTADTADTADVAYAAYAAAYAADADVADVAYAAYAAANATYAADIKKRIIEYGISLVESGKEEKGEL